MIPKFRAWDKEFKEMVQVNALIFDEQVIKATYKNGNIVKEDVKNYELMQSTGLKDKNGQEIFEGDVVTNGWKRQVVTFGTQEVEEDFGSIRIYRGFNLYLGGGYPNAIMSKFEVVGNIYENPDLLEADND